MAETKDYLNLSIDELQKYISKEFSNVLYSYPISAMEARAGIYLAELPDGSLYLDTLNLRPDVQGQGKGKEILEILKNWANENQVGIYLKPAALPDNPTYRGVELTPTEQTEKLFNFYKSNGWEENPNFTALSSNEKEAQLSLSAFKEWGAKTDDLYSPLVYLPTDVFVTDLPKNPYKDDIISYVEKYNKEGKIFLEGYNQPILDEIITEVLKMEVYFGTSGFMEEDDWKKSKLRDVAIELENNGIHPNDVDDISKYIPRDKIPTPAEIFQGGVRNEFFTDGIVAMLSKNAGSFYALNEEGDELFPENAPKRDMRLYHAIAQENEEATKLLQEYVQDRSSAFSGKPKQLNWIQYTSEGDKILDVETPLDTPTNVVDDILKTQLDDIRILNDSGVSDQVDNIMAKKINDLYQTDGDIESFSKYLDNLTPDTFTETNKIKSILGFGKTGTGMRVTSRSINDGIGSRSPIIFDESRIDDLGYVTWKNLQHEYGSFQPSPNNVDGFELVKNLVNEGNEINFESMTDVVIPDTPTNVVDDGPALLETRMKIKTQDPRDFGAPGDVIDERVTGWDDDVVKPNKIFSPNKFDDSFGLPSAEGNRILNAIKTGTATDEDITRFFIYVASKSPNTIYAGKPMNNADAIADIAKIGIFGDIPIKDLIPLGGKDPYLESEFNLVLDNNQTLSSYDRTIILDMVNEKGQFANLKKRMRNVLLDAHNKIYTENANDYFILWRGGNLSRFNTWQSFSKQPETAAMISYQINMSGVGQGGGLNAYVINKNNMIDLDSLGLSHGQEKEIIVLTEAANKPGAKLVNSLEKAEELRNYQDSWELRKTIPEFVDTFPKEGFVVENISTQLNQLGQDTQNFFNDLISGMNPDLKPNKPYEQIIELNNPQLQNAQDIYNKYVAQGGDFNPHYFTSIPTVYETQIVKAQALSNMLDKHDKVINDTGTIKVLDIGGTEGVWGNTLAEIGDEKIYVEIIDPSPVANNLYNKMQTPVNSRFRHEAFSYVIEDQGRFFNDRKMIRFAEFFAGGTKDNTTGLRNPDVQVQGGKYDVVHEAMVFQFVDKNRKAQVDFIADNVLADDGILFIEEKFRNVDAIYNNNEIFKDAFKRNYYTDEQINSKYQNIVGPMGDKQVSVQEIENILGNRFKYVNQYWDSGNFKGYIASNNPLAETFVDEIHLLDTSLTNHRFSTAPTQEELKYAVQKDMRNRGIDLELAKDFAKRFVESNKDFVQKTSDALGEVYKGAKAVGPAAGALGLRGLAKVAPVLAPGDVLVEGALGKVTPYIDDFAKRLGFASLPVKQVLPTYIAADIGAAGAELVSAAMYAYDESQRKAPQQPSQFQESLTRFLLPRELEEEAVQKLQIPQDLQSFYRTPAGEKFLEDNDFGSLFKKQLEQEKLTKYSPGWQLSKAIFSLFGSMGSENSSSEPVYSFDQATEKIGQ